MSIDEIVQEMHAANDELIAFIESCDAQAWKSIVPGDGWTVAADAHHCAEGHAKAAGWLEHMRRGEDVPGSGDAHDDWNAAHAREFENADPAETISLLRANAAIAEKTIRSLSADELPVEVTHGPAGGRVVSVERMVGAFPAHVRGHLERMRSAV